jgi:hypothetical protein
MIRSSLPFIPASSEANGEVLAVGMETAEANGEVPFRRTQGPEPVEGLAVGVETAVPIRSPVSSDLL